MTFIPEGSRCPMTSNYPRPRRYGFRLSGGLLTLSVALCAPSDSVAQQAPFRASVQAGEMLYLSGQIGAAPKGMDPNGPGFEAAAHDAMDRIGKILIANQAGFSDVVKCTVMLADMKKWERFNAVYRGYFAPDTLPARSAFGGVKLAFDAPLEVECIARVPGKRQ